MLRNWNIFDWNIRGINSQHRWDDIRLRTEESSCGIICFQETKRETFDQAYLRNFCHRRFNNYAYIPSIDNSGGIITIWNGNLFTGIVTSQNSYQITIDFTCNLSGVKWTLTNVYGPAHNENRGEFLNWLCNIDTTYLKYWLIMGDFNLIKDPLGRSRPGGNYNNMMNFSSAIQALDLEEIPLKGRNFTWSNMQDDPLLEKLDWIFTSADWTSDFPNTMAFPLARLGSDHIPIHIQVGTHIPKAQLFRIENYWFEFDGIMELINKSWNMAPIMQD
jgi:exonuclease III